VTTTATTTLKSVLDDAHPVLFPSALSKILLGTTFTPLKRTCTLLAPKAAVNLTAIDATGETPASALNPNRLAARKVTTLRVTMGAVAGVLAGGTDAVQAFLALDGPGSASFNTVVKASALKVGTLGNAGGVTVACVADGVNNGSNGGASMTQVGVAVTLHYISGMTTTSDMERAIRGFGATALIEVKTTTTFPNYVLLVGDDDFTATNLASGADTIPATLDLATLGSAQLDTIVEYVPTGIFCGNGVTFAAVPDALAALGTITETGSGATATVVWHYLATTSTVANFETTLAASSTLMAVDTAGTAITVIPNLDATMVGVYVVSDSGAAALLASSTVVGVALLSADGTTITFPSPVGAFVATYVPLTQSPTQWAASFPSL